MYAFLVSQKSTISSSSSLNSLKHANFPKSSTASRTWSSFATISTSIQVKAAKGSASENSKLVVTAILISRGLKTFLCPSLVSSPDCSLDLHSNAEEESLFVLDTEILESSSCFCSFMEPRKIWGWDFKLLLRLCKASLRLWDSASGENWCLFLMLLASSLSTLDTSSASLMQESLYRARVDLVG